MNTLRKILTWRSLHTFLYWAERGVACLCILMTLCAVSLPGGNFSLGMGVIAIGFLLGIIWIAHALTLSILRNYERAEEQQVCFHHYLLTIVLCMVLAFSYPLSRKGRFTLSRGALESAAENIDQHQGAGWIGLYHIWGVEQNGNVVEYGLSGAGMFLENYYLLYAPDGLAEYRSKDHPFRSDPAPLGDNWWYTCYSD